MFVRGEIAGIKTLYPIRGLKQWRDLHRTKLLPDAWSFLLPSMSFILYL